MLMLNILNLLLHPCRETVVRVEMLVLLAHLVLLVPLAPWVHLAKLVIVERL